MQGKTTFERIRHTQDTKGAALLAAVALRGTRVLQILDGSAYGGGTEIVFQICTRLLREGCALSLVTSDPPTVARFRALDIEIISIPEMRRAISPWYDGLAFLKLFRLLHREQMEPIEELLGSHDTRELVVADLDLAEH